MGGPCGICATPGPSALPRGGAGLAASGAACPVGENRGGSSSPQRSPSPLGREKEPARSLGKLPVGYSYRWHITIPLMNSCL